MQSGTVFPLPPSAPLTVVTGSSSWPTPTVADAFTDNLRSSKQKEGSRHSVNLSQAVKMWPTTTVADSRNGANATAKRSPGSRHHSGTTLVDAVRLWPTPMARDGKGGTGPNYTREGGPSLPDAAGGRLNPTWVEWLMGFPAGWTALEGWGTRSSRKSRSTSAGVSSPTQGGA